MNYMHYGEPQYWELRYQDEMQNSMGAFETFDWLIPFKTGLLMIYVFYLHTLYLSLPHCLFLAYPIFENFVSHKDKNNVLVIGVGKSDVIEVLYKNGFREIVAIDISPTVINQMRSQYKDYSGVEWYCMDIRELNFLRDRTFSIIIDKGFYFLLNLSKY